MRTLALCLFSLVLFSCGNNKPNQASTDLVHIDATADSNASVSAHGLPVIKFEKMEHDFGTLTQGEVLEYEFRFTNTGDADLLISNATASCGCTVPQFPKEPVKPGQQGKIRVKFDSALKLDKFRKEVYVTANTEPVQTTLAISGLILAKPENNATQSH